MASTLTCEKIWKIFEQNLAMGRNKLTEIPVYCGTQPEFRGLSGWVFEQTVHHCIQKELRAAGVRVPISEQAKLGTRGKADLQIGNVLIEIKRSGVYSRDDYAKYRAYRKASEKMGCTYLFFSGEETYEPHRTLARNVFGQHNTFYLDTTADWRRLIRRLLTLLRT